MQVVITSKNPAKISAVEAAFKEVFPLQDIQFEGIAVSSDVRAQPMSVAETLTGARNRIANAKQKRDSDFYVSIEAGLDGSFTFAWMVIATKTQHSESRSASLALPKQALDKLQQGWELGDVMDEMFQQQNVKQKGGAIGVLTRGLLTRSQVYHQALILALIPFIQPDLYFVPLDDNLNAY